MIEHIVKIGESFSEDFKTNSGVPQGSVLGPLLFLIFINDLPANLPEGVGIKMYADDVKLYISHKNDSKRDLLSQALLALNKWAIDNGIEISYEKCFTLYLGNLK